MKNLAVLESEGVFQYLTFIPCVCKVGTEGKLLWLQTKPWLEIRGKKRGPDSIGKYFIALCIRHRKEWVNQ